MWRQLGERLREEPNKKFQDESQERKSNEKSMGVWFGAGGGDAGDGRDGEAQNDATPADKERAVAYLEKTKNGVVDATKGLSDAQWNFKPAPDRWSIAEVVEHLAAAEDMIRGLVQEQVMKSPAIEPRDPRK